MGFYAASEYMKASSILLCANLVIHIISFGSPYWSTRRRIVEYDEAMRVDIIVRTGGNAGLWEGCMEGECYERFNLWVASWIKSCQAMMCLSLICLVSTTILSFLYMWHRDFDRDKRLIFINTITGFATPLFTGLAIIVWASSSYLGNGEVLNWPFYLAILSFISSLIIATFIYLELIRPLGKTVTKSPLLLVKVGQPQDHDSSMASWKFNTMNTSTASWR